MERAQSFASMRQESYPGNCSIPDARHSIPKTAPGAGSGGSVASTLIPLFPRKKPKEEQEGWMLCSTPHGFFWDKKSHGSSIAGSKTSPSRARGRNGKSSLFPPQHSKHSPGAWELRFPPNSQQTLVIQQLQGLVPSVLSLSASATSSSEGVTGSEFVLECSSSFQGEGEAEIRIPTLPAFPAQNIPLPHGSEGSSSLLEIQQNSGKQKIKIKKGKTFQGTLSPSLPQLQIFREGSGIQPGFGLPWRLQTLSPGTGWPLEREIMNQSGH